VTSFRRGARRPDDWPSSHVRARAALSDRLDGVLEPSEAGWLDQHLAACAECRATADAYAAQRLELRSLRDRTPVPPRDLWARTAAAIEAEAGGRGRVGTARTGRRSFVVPTAFLATALAVVVATGLLTSSQLVPPRGDGGSVPGVAVLPSSAAAGSDAVAPEQTPITVAKTFDFVARDAEGNLQVKTTRIDELCPPGTSQPCDSGGPVEDRSVTIDQNAQAVYGDGDVGKRLIVVSSPGVAVVTLGPDTATPSPSPTSTPSPSSSAVPSDASASPSPSSTPPSAPPSSAPPSIPASPSPSPTITASPTGSIDVTPPGSGQTREIAHGVALVGQTAAYSSSGSWFAFTARPIDGTAGPDIYLWRVGSEAAQRVTEDGRSVFGSWVEDTLVASRALDPGAAGGAAAAKGLKAQAFLLDPATLVQTDLPQTGSAWRPVVDPSGRKAVYWAGTLEVAPGPGFAPERGKLVLGDWSVDGPVASGGPAATPLSGDQASARREIPIGTGQIDDWDARWDGTGTHLAVWIADHGDPRVGRLSLYAVSAFDGTIDLKSPLLQARRAAAGFALSDGGLIWAEPSDDPNATGGSIQLLAWTDDTVGSVQTLSGPAIVIR
jgi:hypothetical protein